MIDLAGASGDRFDIGQVSLFIPTLGGHIGNIKSGNIRALAVSGANQAEQPPDCSDLQRARGTVRRGNKRVWHLRTEGARRATS
jgi:hypothetical protein